ncbi:UbiA family prenyltransferase [Kribbella koreensis]|uniref:UbiA family prenyltransferase n=1 Tax=Kribbella koreensis TaxID=57909 RepID=A0ABN1R8E9_9ACTN
MLRRTTKRSRLADLAELVRAPAALTVPGDVLAGAVAAGNLRPTRVAGLAASSIAIYWAGMALNDWSDRDLDAVERPERPIPSGRVTPGTALSLASSLTAAGLALSAFAGDRHTFRTSAVLAATAWTYDLKAKNTPLGPAVMAAARSLDVLVGAGNNRRAALPAAAAIGTHILATTYISQGEVHGSTPTSSRAALATTTAITAATARPTSVRPSTGSASTRLSAGSASTRLSAGSASTRLSAGSASTRLSAGSASTRPGTGSTRLGAGPALRSAEPSTAGALLAAVFAGLFARSVGSAQLVAAGDPSAANLRKAVGAGIHGLVPLQAAWCARGGKPLVGAGLMAALPMAKALARKVSPT